MLHRMTLELSPGNSWKLTTSLCWGKKKARDKVRNDDHTCINIHTQQNKHFQKKLVHNKKTTHTLLKWLSLRQSGIESSQQLLNIDDLGPSEFQIVKVTKEILHLHTSLSYVVFFIFLYSITAPEGNTSHFLRRSFCLIAELLSEMML